MMEGSGHKPLFQFVEAPVFVRFRDEYLDDDGFAAMRQDFAPDLVFPLLVKTPYPTPLPVTCRDLPR